MGIKKSVKILLENTAGPILQVDNYGTALQTASRWGHYTVFQLLLDRGANIDTRSARLSTALEAAKHWRQDEIAKLLIDRGAAVYNQRCPNKRQRIGRIKTLCLL